MRSLAIGALAVMVITAGFAIPTPAEAQRVVGYLSIRYCTWRAPRGGTTTTSQYIRQYYGQRSSDEYQWAYTSNRMRAYGYTPLKVWENRVQWYYAKEATQSKGWRATTGGPVRGW